jgi:hypothetical protein
VSSRVVSTGAGATAATGAGATAAVATGGFAAVGFAAGGFAAAFVAPDTVCAGGWSCGRSRRNETAVQLAQAHNVATRHSEKRTATVQGNELQFPDEVA